MVAFFFFSDQKEIICKYIWPKRNYQPQKKKILLSILIDPNFI